MAKEKWIVLHGGHIKRWKKSKSERTWCSSYKVPPHWYRNHLNRKERQRLRTAIHSRTAHGFPYVHPGTASWYW